MAVLRRSRHLLEVIDRLNGAGVGFASVQEAVDTTTPFGRMLATVLGAMAEWERARLRDGLAATRANAIAAGVWVGPVPVGYLRDERTKRLIVDPPAARRVAEGYRMRVEGRPWAEVAKHVGVSAAGARQVIRSRTYLSGDHHEAIVDADVWQAAQPGPVQPGIRNGYKESTGVLRGLVRCTACRRSMCVRRGSYVCGNELCGHTAAQVTGLDELVRDTFGDVLGSDTPLGEMMRERKAHGGAMIEVRRRVADARAAREAFAQEATEAGLSAKDTAAGLAARGDIIATAEAELDRLLSLGAEPLAIAPGLTPEMADLAERRAEMAKVVQAVWITKAVRGATGRGGWGPLADRVRIEWRGEAHARAAAA